MRAKIEKLFGKETADKLEGLAEKAAELKVWKEACRFFDNYRNAYLIGSPYVRAYLVAAPFLNLFMFDNVVSFLIAVGSDVYLYAKVSDAEGR